MTEAREIITVEIDGKEIEAYRLSNGTLKDVKTGYFLTPPDEDHRPITQENASSLARKRWDDYLLGSENAVMAVTKTDHKVAAYQKLVENIAGMALDPQKGRVAVEAFKEVSKALDARPDRRQNNQFFVQNAQIAVVPGELLAGIIDDVSTIDVQVVDNE